MEYPVLKWQTMPVERFDDFSTQWSTLNQRNADSLLLSPDFIAPLFNHFPVCSSALLLLGFDQEQLMCGMVVEKLGFGRWQTYQAEQSPLGLFLLDEALNIEDILPQIIEQLPGVVLTLGITQQDPNIVKRPGDSNSVATLDYIETGKLTIPADFDDYWAKRSKNSRQNVSKANNRLAKEDISVMFKAETSAESMKACVISYGEIESSGWKAEQGKAININNAQGAFYNDLLMNLAPEKAQVWQYFYNDELVATDLCINDKNVIILLKTTFDETNKKHSPAFCMHVDGIKYAMAQQLKLIEFYGPAMQWHRKLTDELRTMYHVTWHNYPLLSKLIRLIK